MNKQRGCLGDLDQGPNSEIHVVFISPVCLSVGFSLYDLSFPFIYCGANVSVIIELDIRGTRQGGYI